MKKCSKCKRELQSRLFSKNRTMNDGLQHYCKECKGSVDGRLKRDKNWEARTRLRHEQEFDRLGVLPKRRCKECNEERLLIDMTRNWQYRFGFTFRCKLCSNDSRKGKQLGKRWKVLLRDNFQCQYCGRGAPNVELQVDHIFPSSKGGDNKMENLVTACRDCNLGKSDKTFNSKV